MTIQTKDAFSIDLTSEAGRLDYAQQLYQRFLEDMLKSPDNAKTRLISGVQIALRESHERGYIEPLFFYQAADEKSASA